MDITVIKQLYTSGKSLAQLSKESQISVYKLKKILIAEGVHIRSKEEQNKYSPQNQRKYEVYDEFFDEVFSLSGDGVHLIADEKPKFGDRVLILSTCLRTDRTKRYLVIAKEIT